MHNANLDNARKHKAKETGKSTASVKRALSRLIEEGLVYFDGGEYKIDNPFFAEWVKRR